MTEDVNIAVDPESKVVLTLPVSAVTLFEDRAEVVRRGTCPAPGPREVVIDNVSPLISAERTKVRATERESGKAILVDDVRVEHVWVEKPRVDQARLEEIRTALLDANDRLDLLDERLRFNRTLKERTAEAFSRWQRRTAWASVAGPVDESTWREQGRALEQQLLEAVEAAEPVMVERQKVAREKAQLEEMADDNVEPERSLHARLILRLSHATTDIDFEIASRVPCALWRPTHEAHLVPTPLSEGTKGEEIEPSRPFDEQAPTDPGVGTMGEGLIDFASAESGGLSVQWTVLGALWQQTGEDWNAVDIFLSTERPSKGAVLPTLVEDRLQTRQKTAEEKKVIKVEHRTEAAKPDAQLGVVPGVYDGGEARHFQIPSKVTLKSDGRPKQVQVKTFATDVRVDRVAFPDESARVFRRASLENTLDIPLLAGPVSLRESGAFLGVGDLRYVGPHEKFSLSFGTDDGLVVRTRRFSSVETRRIAKDKVHHVTEVTLLSARAHPALVDVILRWPVSELEQVKVETSPSFTTGGTPNPDADGLVHVPVTVPASGRKLVQLGFSFDTASGVDLPPPW